MLLCRSSLLVAVLVLAGAAAVPAHGPPADIEIWGNYPRSHAGCQRAISQAAAACGLRGLRARVDCGLAQLNGEICPQAEIDSRIQRARAETRALVRQVCTTTEARGLLYVDVDEALVDMINVCRQTENAGFSAIFGPLLQNGAVQPRDQPAARCVAETAAAARKMLRFSIGQVRAVLNRIASSNVPRSQKVPLIDRRRDRIAAALETAAARIERHCGADDFEATYGRSAGELLTNLIRHSECFGGGLYVQDEVVCDPPICGNGVQEAGEDCDDGNTSGGDNCAANCRR
ncbi:MAG TPA: hypothetical protein VEB21_18410 [Terriglobales bacterium]|nr:hypothetical protein [Terriglobales bacterium]